MSLFVKKILLLLFVFAGWNYCSAQNNTLNYFLDAAEKNNPALLQNDNLQEIGRNEDRLINARNNAFQVYATSEVMLAPFFNNNGSFIDVTTNPSPDAYGYAEPVSNGALYSAQLNITKEIFVRARLQNLLFQNKLKNRSLVLDREELRHQLQRNVTQAYIQVYQLQIKAEITKDIIYDLENRLKVVELLVKKGILMQSDYLLLELEVENKKLELQQIENDINANLLKMNNAVGITVSQGVKLDEPVIHVDPSLQSYLDSIPGPRELARYPRDSIEIDKEDLPKMIRPTDTLMGGNRELFYERRFKNDSLQLLAEQQVFENRYKPQLSAYANTGLNAVEIDRIPHNFGFSAGLQLNVPIYDGGQKEIKQLQTERKLQNLQYQKEIDELQKQNTLSSLRTQMASIKTGLELLDEQLKKQEHLLEIYKGKMLQGQASIIDYLKMVENYKRNMDTKLQMKVNLWLLENEYNATNW